MNRTMLEIVVYRDSRVDEIHRKVKTVSIRNGGDLLITCHDGVQYPIGAGYDDVAVSMIDGVEV